MYSRYYLYLHITDDEKNEVVIHSAYIPGLGFKLTHLDSRIHNLKIMRLYYPLCTRTDYISFSYLFKNPRNMHFYRV